MKYFDILYKKYNKFTLTKQEVANELGLSVRTLDRMRKSGELELNEMPRGKYIQFSLKSVAELIEALHDLGEVM